MLSASSISMARYRTVPSGLAGPGEVKPPSRKRQPVLPILNGSLDTWSHVLSRRTKDARIESRLDRPRAARPGRRKGVDAMGIVNQTRLSSKNRLFEMADWV